MKFLELVEQVQERKIRVKVIRGGKRKIITKSDNPNQKIVGGKSVRFSKQEQLKRKRSQRKGVIKRRAKKNLSNSRRARSLKKRTF